MSKKLDMVTIPLELYDSLLTVYTESVEYVRSLGIGSSDLPPMLAKIELILNTDPAESESITISSKKDKQDKKRDSREKLLKKCTHLIAKENKERVSFVNKLKEREIFERIVDIIHDIVGGEDLIENHDRVNEHIDTDVFLSYFDDTFEVSLSGEVLTILKRDVVDLTIKEVVTMLVEVRYV